MFIKQSLFSDVIAIHTALHKRWYDGTHGVCRIVAQVAEALEVAHQSGVAHQDLKPANLILKNDAETVVITDFGISATLRDGLIQTAGNRVAGTLYFLAPEQVEAMDSEGAEFGPQVDIWALGVTVYYLLARTYPFSIKKNDPRCVLDEEPRPLTELLPYISDNLWSLIERIPDCHRYSLIAAGPANETK